VTWVRIAHAIQRRITFCFVAWLDPFASEANRCNRADCHPQLPPDHGLQASSDSPFSLKPIEDVTNISYSSPFMYLLCLWRNLLDSINLTINLSLWSQWGISSDEGAAWPIANPAVICAGVSEAGFDRSFVANPFLFIQVWSSLFASISIFSGDELKCWF
jgi:hypothetical protein